jgi:hypothetical protein
MIVMKNQFVSAHDAAAAATTVSPGQPSTSTSASFGLANGRASIIIMLVRCHAQNYA